MKQKILYLLILVASSFLTIEAQQITAQHRGGVIWENGSNDCNDPAAYELVGKTVAYYNGCLDNFRVWNGTEWSNWGYGNAEPIEDIASTQKIDLGDIGTTAIEDAFNAHTFTGSEDPIQDQDDGYVLIDAIQNGDPVQYLFVGDGGEYGTGGTLTATEEDFTLLNETEAVDQTWYIRGTTTPNTSNNNWISHRGNISVGGNLHVSGKVQDGDGSGNPLYVEGNKGILFTARNPNNINGYDFYQNGSLEYGGSKDIANVRIRRNLGFDSGHTYTDVNISGLRIAESIDLANVDPLDATLNSILINPTYSNATGAKFNAIKSNLGDFDITNGDIYLRDLAGTASNIGIDADGKIVTRADGGSGGSGGVESVTGDSVNNTDPNNPVVNAIPLSGTTSGNPVTDDIVSDAKMVFKDLDGFYNTYFGFFPYFDWTGLIREGGDGSYSAFLPSINPSIIRINTDGDNNGMIVDEDYINIFSDNNGFKGFKGGSYYGANYDDNTYVQKKYVDDAISGSSMTDAEVKAAYENNANTNAYTDIEKNKLANAVVDAPADNDRYVRKNSSWVKLEDNIENVEIDATTYTLLEADIEAFKQFFIADTQTDVTITIPETTLSSDTNLISIQHKGTGTITIQGDTGVTFPTLVTDTDKVITLVSDEDDVWFVRNLEVEGGGGSTEVFTDLDNSIFVNEGYINATGVFVSSSSYASTDFVYLSDTFKVEDLQIGGSQKAIVYFNANKEFVDFENTDNGTITTIPEGAVFAKFSTTTTKLPTAKVSLKFKDNLDTQFALSILNGNTDTLTIDNSLFTESGYIGSDGLFVSHPAYRCTDFIYALDVSVINYTDLYNSGSPRPIVFYDKDKQFIEAINVVGGSQATGSLDVIPSNAVYFKFTTANSYIATVNVDLLLESINTSESIDNLNKSIENMSADISNISSIKSTSKNILVAGSSITWGNGDLTDKTSSGSGYWVDTMLDKLSNTTYYNEVSSSGTSGSFVNSKLTKGQALEIEGTGSKINFNLYCDEINIAQVIRRTDEYANVIVKADGVQILSFNNINHTYEESITESFTGDGTTASFQLDNAYTYNHVLTIDGVSKDVVIHTGGFSSGYEFGGSAPYSAVIVRSWDDVNKKVVHSLRFKDGDVPADTVPIVITYDKGKVIQYENSTVGQTDTDEENEGNYGVGGTSYDPLNPSSIGSGMEYRTVDERAFNTYKFDDGFKDRSIEIEIVSGSANPYFIFDFATVRKHILTNAGIGGWSLQEYMNPTPLFNMDVLHFLKFGKPDIMFFQPGLGDDFYYKERKIKRTVTNETEETALSVVTRGEVDLITYVGADDYTIRYCTGIIDAITPQSLTSSHIVGSTLAVGDLIRIGNYYGDNRQVVEREVKTVDLGTGVVTWVEPLIAENILNINSLDDLVGAEVSGRDLSDWYDDLKDFVEVFQSMSPDTKIVMVTSENSNYFFRQSWGYKTILRKIGLEYNNVTALNAEEWFEEKVNNWISGDLYEEIVSDGSSEYELEHDAMYQGYKVIVDGIDLYGDNAVIVQGVRRGVDQSLSGASISITGAYQGETIIENNKLIFLSDPPAIGKTIRIERAKAVWGEDLTHPNEYGGNLYGQLYQDLIIKL